MQTHVLKRQPFCATFDEKMPLGHPMSAAKPVKLGNKRLLRVVFMQIQEHASCANARSRLILADSVTNFALHHSMRWNKPNSRNAPHDLPGRDRPSSTAWVRNQGLEEVRRAMLQLLVGLTGCEVARMSMRLRYAGDIEALWYLRTDLFDTLVPLRGQCIAQTVLKQVTALFQGQLPFSPRKPQGPHAPRAHR